MLKTSNIRQKQTMTNILDNLLLLPLSDGWVSQYFNMEGHPGYDKKENTHNGLDIGWCVNQHCDILACQDGTVVQILNNSSVGHGVVLQHDYSDGHRWTGYIHLKEPPCVKKNDRVKQGQKIGVRGGSPYINGKQKFGTHLHLYVSAVTNKAYTWDTMKKLVVDPYPLLYRSKAIEYDRINETLSCKPFIEDMIPEVVAPVERDENVNQLSESTSKLRVRMEPSLKGNIIGFLQPNAFYNYYETATADGYEWYKIADEQWCAQTGTMTIYPKKCAEVERLKTEVERLTIANDKLTQRIAEIRKLTTEE